MPDLGDMKFDWGKVIEILLANAPAIIKTAFEFIEWAKATLQSTGEALNKPAEDVTADELLAHIQQMNRQQAEIDARP